jgi:hypothetical protein
MRKINEKYFHLFLFILVQVARDTTARPTSASNNEVIEQALAAVQY